MKKLIKIAAFLLAALMLTSCGAGNTESKPKTQKQDKVNLFVISGPTGIGSLNLWEKSDNGETENKYNVTLTSSNDEVVAALSNGSADIAAVSTVLASTVYNKTKGKIKVLAVNTTGVLSILSNEDITTFSDLRGKTLYSMGQGANPEYILNYLLAKNGLDPKKDLTVKFVTEASELLTVWANEPKAAIMAPQPVTTSLLARNTGCKKVLDMTEEWNKVSLDSSLMMGCVIARSDYIKSNPKAVKTFLKEYNESVLAAQNDVKGTAKLCAEKRIISNAALAEKAIPECGLTVVLGEEMKTGLSGYLKAMFEQNPKSVGGELPKDDFYYDEK